MLPTLSLTRQNDSSSITQYYKIFSSILYYILKEYYNFTDTDKCYSKIQFRNNTYRNAILILILTLTLKLSIERKITIDRYIIK